MYKIKIKHIILILLFIFVIYNFFTYKEHFVEEVIMPGQTLTITDTIPKLVFKSYEGCPKLYHIFRGLKDDKGNIENVDGLRFKNKIVSKFFNLDNTVIEERPIIDVSRKRFSVNLGDNIYLLFYETSNILIYLEKSIEDLLISNDNKILNYNTRLGGSDCLITDGTPDDNCKPIEVHSLLPYLEEKKNFIDRVMPLIIGKVDGKFIRYLIDYKSIINQEYTKLNRIKESPEFIYQSELDSYYVLSVVQENTDSDSNTNIYGTYQQQNYVKDEHYLFYETIGDNTSTKYNFTQLFSYIHKYFNDLHTFYDFIINENPFQEFEDIMDNMDVALGKFISQKNSIKLKYKELCELIFDYLYVGIESSSLNLKTEVEKLKILQDKANVTGVTIDGTLMSIPQKIIDIKDVLDTEIESLNNDYKSFIDNIKDKLNNIGLKFNPYKDDFVDINNGQFGDIEDISLSYTTQYVPILNKLYLKDITNLEAKPNYEAYFEKKKNDFTTELELERLEYLVGEEVDTYSEEIQNFIDSNLDMSAPNSLFLKIYNLISSYNFNLLEIFKNVYILNNNYYIRIEELIDTRKLNIFTKQFLNNIASINDYLIDIPPVGVEPVEPSEINYSNFVDKLISFYNDNSSPIDTTLTNLINNHFLAELASEYPEIIGVSGNIDINLIFTLKDEIKTNIQTSYQTYKTQKQAYDEDMKLSWITHLKDNYENINLYNNDLIQMYNKYNLIYQYLEENKNKEDFESEMLNINRVIEKKKNIELKIDGLIVTTKQEYDNKLKFERTEETTNKLKEIMNQLLFFIKTNGGGDSLDIKPNIEFKYNDDSDYIKYDKENHIEQDEKQVISKVKVNFTEEDVVNFTEYCFNKLCYKVISIDQLTFTGNHFRALKCNNCNNFYELPERIRKQAMKEEKEYTRAKCAGCFSNIIVYFDKVPKKFNEYGNLNEEPDPDPVPQGNILTKGIEKLIT